MEFNFVLPLRFEDLQTTAGNSYCVTKVFNEKDCSEKLRGEFHCCLRQKLKFYSFARFVVAKLAFAQQGATYIFDHFDVFYSIIANASDVQVQTIFRASELLYKSIDALGSLLAEFLREPSQSSGERDSMLNVLKMLIYANITLVKKVDKDVIVAEGKKTKKQTAEDANNSKWEELRYNALLQLFNILTLPLGNLWDPPVAEEPFVNICADFAYRTIEHPSVKQKNVEDAAFQALALLLKNYNHAIVFPTKIFELMKSSELSATAIAGGVVVLFEQHGIQTILKVIIEQILNGLDASVSDGPVVKNISTFFTELGNNAPTLVMPFIRDIASDVLNLESYQLRICILQLMSEIVMGELTGEQLTPEQKETRDEYLDHTFSHILDVNAHVRSKCLSLWANMKHENAVPLSWLSPVVKVTVDRLEDKSNLVRKNAINLIKSFLERNPYAAKLSLEELEQRYEEKSKELSDLRKKMVDESDKMDEVNEQWELTLNELKPYIVQCLALESIEDERIRPEECENIYLQFPKLVEDKEYER